MLQKLPVLTFSRLCILVLLAALTSCNNGENKTAGGSNKTPPPVRKVPAGNIVITAVGDLMLGSAYPSAAALAPADGAKLLAPAMPVLKGNVVFGNLEGCLLNGGQSAKCKGMAPGRCYAFRMPVRYTQHLKAAGFNMLSIANNHIGDFNNPGRLSTMKVLDSAGIAYAGQLQKPYTVIRSAGHNIALCAFAPNENTPSINNIPAAMATVRQLKAAGNIVIVSFHGGGEGASHEHVTGKDEIFMGENRGNVRAFAHAVINAGADIVLGHGPHVTRGVEVYKRKFIAYSMGNFCTWGSISLAGPNGLAPLLQCTLNPQGDFISANVISFRQLKGYGLKRDYTHAAWHKIVKLSHEDGLAKNLVFNETAQQIKTAVP